MGWRDQPLFRARSQSHDSENCLKVSLERAQLEESRPRGPCGGKGAESFPRFKPDAVNWGGSLPPLFPFARDESLFWGRIVPRWCWQWHLDCIYCNAKSKPWRGGCIPYTEHTARLMLLPGRLGGFTQVSRDNFLWEQLCQSSALDCNNLSLRASPVICLYSSLHN